MLSLFRKRRNNDKKKGYKMIVLNLELKGIYGFNDFNINFSYPKKIINSIIDHEHLEGRESSDSHGSKCNRKDQPWKGIASNF